MFSIVTDTSSNLTGELLDKYGVTEVSFSYSDGTTEVSGQSLGNFDGPAFYAAMRSGVKITTSQVTPGRYLDAWTPILSRGEDVLFVGMSSGVSGSQASAEIAAAELREAFPDRTIRLVDTLAASLGEGLQVIRAAELREQGLSVDETADLLLEERFRMCQIFTVDDLSYLRRTGRLSNATAILAAALHIKPLLKGNREGKIVSFARVKGRQRSVEALAAEYDQAVRHADGQMVGIAHADCAADAEKLAELLRKNHPPREILTVCYEPVTGSHVGPGALALFFMGDEHFRG